MTISVASRPGDHSGRESWCLVFSMEQFEREGSCISLPEALAIGQVPVQDLPIIAFRIWPSEYV